MSIPESGQLQSYIEELAIATREGTFRWENVNPTTYVWQRLDEAGHGARLNLQRIVNKTASGSSNATIYYQLQVMEMAPNASPLERLRISGQSDAELNTSLKDLFQLIRSGITRQGLDFFKDLLGNK